MVVTVGLNGRRAKIASAALGFDCAHDGTFRVGIGLPTGVEPVASEAPAANKPSTVGQMVASWVLSAPAPVVLSHWPVSSEE